MGVSDMQDKHQGGHIKSAEQIRRRFDTLSGAASPLHRQIEIPVMKPSSLPSTPEALRLLEQAHTARYINAQHEQREAQRLYTEILAMKEPLTKTTDQETRDAIDSNIRSATRQRQAERKRVRSHWQQLSQIEKTRQLAVILNYDRLYRTSQRQLQLEALLVAHITGKSIDLILASSAEEERISTFWRDEILPVVLLVNDGEDGEMVQDGDENAEDTEEEGEEKEDDSRGGE